MENNQNISYEIRLLISEALNINVENIPADASQNNFPEWDSIAYLSILSSIEDKYGVSISEDNIENFGSVPEIVDIVIKCQK